jgi:hypothetical protein
MTPDKARSLANDLICAIATLKNIVDDLSSAHTDSEPEQQAQTTSAQVPEPELIIDYVRKSMAEKARDGFTDKMRELLRKYGVDKLSELNQKHFAAILADVAEVK